MRNYGMLRFNKWALQEFYKTLAWVRFEALDEERLAYLDSLVEDNRFYFNIQTTDMKTLATSAALLLNKDLTRYKFLNRDEIAYFYIKMVDPEFRFLEVYESVATIKEMKATCKLNFGYYDNAIIFLERLLNKKFHLFESDELWMRESIKRTRKMFD